MAGTADYTDFPGYLFRPKETEVTGGPRRIPCFLRCLGGR